MVRLLQRPGIQGLLALVSLTSAGLLTGVPLVKADLPTQFYACLLVLLLVCQVGQISAYVVAVRELDIAKGNIRKQLSLAGSEAIRLLVRDVCHQDPLLTSLDVDLSWAARVTTVEDARLLEVDWGQIGLTTLPQIDVSTRRVRVVDGERRGQPPRPGLKMFSAGDVQGVTGLRFEVFYLLPDDVDERDGVPLGHNLLDRLIKDDLIGFLHTRLSA